jgi:hypothetical protein
MDWRAVRYPAICVDFVKRMNGSAFVLLYQTGMGFNVRTMLSTI